MVSATRSALKYTYSKPQHLFPTIPPPLNVERAQKSAYESNHLNDREYQLKHEASYRKLRSFVTAARLYAGDVPCSGKLPGSRAVGCVSEPAGHSERAAPHVPELLTASTTNGEHTSTTCTRESLLQLDLPSENKN